MAEWRFRGSSLLASSQNIRCCIERRCPASPSCTLASEKLHASQTLKASSSVLEWRHRLLDDEGQGFHRNFRAYHGLSCGKSFYSTTRDKMYEETCSIKTTIKQICNVAYVKCFRTREVECFVLGRPHDGNQGLLQFSVKEEVGYWAFARVYKAQDRETNEELTLKVTEKKFLNKSPIRYGMPRESDVLYKSHERTKSSSMCVDASRFPTRPGAIFVDSASSWGPFVRVPPDHGQWTCRRASI